MRTKERKPAKMQTSPSVSADKIGMQNSHLVQQKESKATWCPRLPNNLISTIAVSRGAQKESGTGSTIIPFRLSVNHTIVILESGKCLLLLDSTEGSFLLANSWGTT